MQPPPTPVSQYGYYREVQLAADLQAKVLVDQYGRLILHVEDDVTYALVWNVESGIIDVNSEGRYNTQLAEWIANFDKSQYSYMFNETNNYTIIADSDEEDIVLDDTTGEWLPSIGAFNIGAETIFWRQIQTSDRVLKVWCDSNGLLLTLPMPGTGYQFIAAEEASQWIWQFYDIGTSSADIVVQLCGGSVAGEVILTEQSVVCIIGLDGYYVNMDGNSDITSGSVVQLQG